MNKPLLRAMIDAMPVRLCGAAKQQARFEEMLLSFTLIGVDPEPYIERAKVCSHRSSATFLQALDHELWRASQCLGPSDD